MWSKSTDYTCGKAPAPHAQMSDIRHSALPRTFYSDKLSFSPSAEPINLGKTDQESKYVCSRRYLKPHLILADKSLSSALVLEDWVMKCSLKVWWWDEASLVAPQKGQRCSCGNNLLKEQKERVPRGTWWCCSVGRRKLFELHVVSCPTLWLTEYPNSRFTDE